MIPVRFSSNQPPRDALIFCLRGFSKVSSAGSGSNHVYLSKETSSPIEMGFDFVLGADLGVTGTVFGTSYSGDDVRFVTYTTTKYLDDMLASAADVLQYAMYLSERYSGEFDQFCYILSTALSSSGNLALHGSIARWQSDTSPFSMVFKRSGDGIIFYFENEEAITEHTLTTENLAAVVAQTKKDVSEAKVMLAAMSSAAAGAPIKEAVLVDVMKGENVSSRNYPEPKKTSLDELSSALAPLKPQLVVMPDYTALRVTGSVLQVRSALKKAYGSVPSSSEFLNFELEETSSRVYLWAKP